MALFIEVVGYLLFKGPPAFVFLPLMIVTLIAINPYVGRVLGLFIMSALLTSSTPRPYRILTAIALPEIAIFYVLGDSLGAYVSLAWAAFVILVWRP